MLLGHVAERDREPVRERDGDAAREPAGVHAALRLDIDPFPARHGGPERGLDDGAARARHEVPVEPSDDRVAAEPAQRRFVCRGDAPVAVERVQRFAERVAEGEDRGEIVQAEQRETLALLV